MASGASLSDRTLNRLWLRMAQIFGPRWTTAFGDTPAEGAGELWASGLANMTAAQIKRGIAAAALGADPWPPTLPAFRALCLGIPSQAAALKDAQGPRREPFSRLLWSFVDSWTLAHVDTSTAQRLLRDAYMAAVEHMLAGGLIPDAPAGSLSSEPPPPRTPASRAAALAELAQMNQILGGPDLETDEDTGPDDLEPAP